jgi:hypothetical protein
MSEARAKKGDDDASKGESGAKTSIVLDETLKDLQ